ncbi:hypothetical protein FHR92_000319 [Fontibacillus solani]|uniref:DUF3600 domain-containing protein n=1 Tax=Fontibacillus solani TaxID=1572857 RepID=A0A7W3SPM0_9BACL|nr:DUF3600 domain-containing protein [Fontibacillus solani]MBA9083876.1 hypothetical protein [Fontibacillus solani]
MNRSLKEELDNIQTPIEIHEMSKMGVRKAKAEMGTKVKAYVRRRLVTAILAVCLIIPTSAFAVEALHVDGLFGSFDNFKRHAAGATMEGYLLLNAKISQAEGDMGQEQFKHFKGLLKVIITAKIEYGDKYGNIDYSQVPAEKLEEIKKVMYEVQPYFDQLNGQPSSKEVLTSEEYEQYINALITYEQILVESENNVANIPADLQDELNEARDVLYYVSDKQSQHSK